jgi:hypothetical protein
VEEVGEVKEVEEGEEVKEEGSPESGFPNNPIN